MYKTQQDLLAKNINPVVMDMLVRDAKTLPPKSSNKQQGGRPSKKRIQNRSKLIDPSTQSTMICSKCKESGHNKRTCDRRNTK